jgi:hypothetical protein
VSSTLSPPTPQEVRLQLERMLRSRELVVRPRTARLLRFFVEESLRNDFAPIQQRLIGTHVLGLGDDFHPTHSAHVRVNIARMRKAIDGYYAGTGRVDVILFTVSQGPYRLVVARRSPSEQSILPLDARKARRRRPLVLVVEPQAVGMRGGGWNNDASPLSSSYRNTLGPSGVGPNVGFRLVSPVPEPATLGMTSVGGLCACGWWILKRRRRART